MIKEHDVNRIYSFNEILTSDINSNIQLPNI